MHNFDLKKEDNLTQNRLFTSYTIQIKKKKAVLKLFNESLDISVLAGILDDIIILDPLKEMKGFAKIIKYQINDKDRHRFLIRDFIEGKTLNSFIEENQISAEKAISMSISLAENIKFLADLGLYHASLNPGNIIIDKSDRILILDSYINKVRLPDMNSYSDLEPFDLCFLPPEYFIKEANLDIISDIYSIGCILYYLIARKPPFMAENKEIIVQNHLWNSYRRSLPVPYDKLFQSILSPDRNARPQSTAELTVLLKRFRSEDSINIEKPGKPIVLGINHGLICELLEAHLCSKNIIIELDGYEKFSNIIISGNQIKYIEYKKVSDSFAHQLFKNNILQGDIIDDLFPYLQNHQELIRRILDLDSIDHDKIYNHYRQWLSDVIINEIICTTGKFTVKTYENESPISNIAGLDIRLLLLSVFSEKGEQIIENYKFYMGSFTECSFRVADTQSISSEIQLKNTEIAVLSALMQTPRYKDFISIMGNKIESNEKIILKLLFLSLLLLEGDENTAEEGEITIPNEPESPKQEKTTPFIGPLRKHVDKDSSPAVKILKSSNGHKNEIENIDEKPAGDDYMGHSSTERAFSDNHVKAKIYDNRGADNKDEGQIEQKRIFAASLLQTAKEFYGNIQFSEANESITEALKIAPNNPTLLYWKAKILARIPDEINNAREYFERAINKDPKNYEIIEDYGAYLVKTGNNDEAVKVLNMLLSVYPHSEKAKDMLKAIEKENRSFLNRLFS